MTKWSVWLFVAMMAVVLAACSTGETAPTRQATPEVPLVTKANADSVLAEGSVQPARSSELSFKVPGQVVEILVQAGDRVRDARPDTGAAQR